MPSVMHLLVMGRVHLWQQAYVLRRQASVTTFLFEVPFWNRDGIRRG